MIQVNPYESPRVPAERGTSASWFAQPRGLQPHQLERLVVVMPLLPLGLLLAGGICLRGVVVDMRSFYSLEEHRQVYYFQPPHGDEAAWGTGFGLCAGVLVLLLVITFDAIPRRAVRSRTERWLHGMGALLCCLPLLLHIFAEDHPFQLIDSPGHADVLALTTGLGMLSAVFQIWFWWNRKQAVGALLRLFRWYLAFCANVERWIRHLLPGRP